MKKILALLLTACMVFALAGCGKKAEATPSPSPVVTATPAPTLEPTPEPVTYSIKDIAGEYAGSCKMTDGSVEYVFNIELKEDGKFDFACTIKTAQGDQDLEFNGTYTLANNKITATVQGYLPVVGEIGEDFTIKVASNMVFGDNAPEEFLYLEKK